MNLPGDGRPTRAPVQVPGTTFSRKPGKDSRLRALHSLAPHEEDRERQQGG